jgi:hypothetical protein
MLTSYRWSYFDTIDPLFSNEGGTIRVESEVFENLTAQPLPRPLDHKTGEREGSAAMETIHAIPDAAEKTIILDPDISILNDARWDLSDVYSSRFCSEHGQKEWLLLYADR